MTRVAGDWIERAETQRVCRLLTEAGHQALFVGGCVRNALLDRPVADIDLATDAAPDVVIRLAQARGLRAIPTGLDHGTVTVVSGKIPHEVTTFRRDVETDGRHAVVAFATDAEEDARRRDFTMNALYATPEGKLVDPLDGLADLRAGRVRFIENAEARIREDYLRILRFFRFHAWYGDASEGLDPRGLAACAELAEGLDGLSKERVGSETRKLLSAPDPSPAVAGMAAAGCLARIVPGADARALPVLVHLEGIREIAPDPIRRLAVLGGRNEDDLLRLSRKEARHLSRIREYLGQDLPADELGYRAGQDLAQDVILLRAALGSQAVADGTWAELRRGAEARFPLRAADLPADLEGPALGERLRQLEEAWIASGFELDKAALLARFP